MSDSRLSSNSANPSVKHNDRRTDILDELFPLPDTGVGPQALSREDDLKRALSQRWREIFDPSLRVPPFAAGDGRELQEVFPTSRERIAQWLLGEKPSPHWRELVRGLMGTTGIGPQTVGVVDFSPAGPGLAAQEQAQRGDFQGAALSTIPGMPMARRVATPIKGLFSAAEGAIRNAPFQKASWQDWSNYFRNKGVKEEELSWEGLGTTPKVKPPAWMPSQGDQVDQVVISKKELADWIARNEIRVGEFVKYPGHPAVLERAARERARLKQFEDMKKGQFGEDWERRLPSQDRKSLDELRRNRDIAQHTANLQAENPDIVMDGGKNYQERLFVLQHPELRSFTGHNWREPGVLILGHVRHEDREIGGKKTLHLDEIQSDLHQPRRFMLKHGLDEIRGGPRLADLPEAPFEKTWGDLFLKRMILHAAENNHEQLSLTPGEVHIRRNKESPRAEGNRVWYDKILVNKLNEIGKPYGAKVEWRAFPEFEENARIVVFPITPALRNAALEKGFAKFSLTPLGAGALTPLFSDASEPEQNSTW
jgi:hypothetical protein